MPAMRRSGVAGALAGAAAWRLLGSADLLLGRAGEELGASSSAHHSPAHREVVGVVRRLVPGTNKVFGGGAAAHHSPADTRRRDGTLALGRAALQAS